MFQPPHENRETKTSGPSACPSDGHAEGYRRTAAQRIEPAASHADGCPRTPLAQIPELRTRVRFPSPAPRAAAGQGSYAATAPSVRAGACAADWAT